jgi:acetylornithine deacetylase/succinyl-diaminopimelate desuccinylase-like protein
VVAEATLSIRTVRGQNVREVADEVELLVRRGAPKGASVEIEQLASTSSGHVAGDSGVIRIGLDVFERTVGRRPVLLPSGATLPVLAALAVREIPTILTGFSLPESNVHAPNERLRIEYLDIGVQTASDLLTAFGALTQLETTA